MRRSPKRRFGFRRLETSDLLGDFDGFDFLAWQRDTNGGNLADWENDFGMTGGTLAAASAVPEPTTGMLLLARLIFAMLFQPRRDNLRRAYAASEGKNYSPNTWKYAKKWGKSYDLAYLTGKTSLSLGCF